jgi:hypothetical protein
MTYGEDNPDAALSLVRWLGPGAELVEPLAWREMLRCQLTAMLEGYADAEQAGEVAATGRSRRPGA